MIDKILGGILQVNYTIDPSVSGQVTFHTVTPLARAAMIPTLQVLLSQHKAVLVQSNGLYRVMPAGKATAPTLAADAALGGATVLSLRYASAPRLAATLQPYAANGSAIFADPNTNALVIQGDPAARRNLTALAQAFDVDALAKQSYELFPAPGGDTNDFAAAFSAALVSSRETTGPQAGTGAVKVVPLEQLGAVLLVASSQSSLNNVARVYAVLSQAQHETIRSWHVLYLRNSRANDAAYLLQQAFTPDNVTAQPTPANKLPGSGISGSTGNTGEAPTGKGNGGSTTSFSDSNGVGGLLGASVISQGSSEQNSDTGSTSPDDAAPSPGARAEASAMLGTVSSRGSAAAALQIIPDNQDHAVLVDASPQEEEQIEGMLAKIDILPVQVRIDATVAEVDLTAALQYGTQFVFKSGDINTVLSNSTSASLASNFPGFVLSSNGGDAAPLAISALQSLTKVRVLSASELTVLDGQAASLLSGTLVPYLTQSSQSITSPGAPVTNAINYQETGVILRVTPYVGNDGMVTLDVEQEVSGVAPNITTAGINSPTFTDRTVASRVAIEDGQTVGLAGIVFDNDSHQNQGIPYLKNVPLLCALFGSQNNNRTREEMLVLITPHIIASQQQALDLTADLEEQLPGAAGVPGALQATPFTASADPDAGLGAKLNAAQGARLTQ